MNSNIWKDNKTLPEFGRDVLIMLNPGNYIVSDAGNFEIFHPIKWCYLDDLLSQSTRVEKLQGKLNFILDNLNYWLESPILNNSQIENQLLRKDFVLLKDKITKGDNDE